MSKTIFVTEANSLVGRASSELLVATGNRVFAAMRDPVGRDREQANALWSRGIEVITLDVTNQYSVEKAVASARNKAGTIDVLINNAEVSAVGSTEAIKPEEITAIFETNVIGMMRVTRAMLPSMRSNGTGLIINIGSVLGRLAMPFMGPYCASKFAVEALGDSLRYEIANSGIDVVTVQPELDPAGLYTAAMTPGGANRYAMQGMCENEPAAFFERLGASMPSSSASDPRTVAIALEGLIETPAGSRPERLIIGRSLGAERINDVAQAAQSALLGRL